MLGAKRGRRERFIRDYRFSIALEDRFSREHPEVAEPDRELVFGGLTHWFQVCRLAGREFVAIPSIAVDHAWHEFILFTRDYADFCDRGLGRFLHHTPTEGLTVSDARDTMRGGYVLAWHHACAIDGVDPFEPERLPLLFAVDERVGIEGGFRYDLAAIAGERSAARRRSAQSRVSTLKPSLHASPWWPGEGAHGTAALAAVAATGCAGGRLWSPRAGIPRTRDAAAAAEASAAVEGAAAVVDAAAVGAVVGERVSCPHG